jgi:hypothetical protein
LGDADVTGSYCPLPDDWLDKKFGTYFTYFPEFSPANGGGRRV